ncbi:FixJ family two-component response regulator [Duganella sp. SG902]|uniref:response regulator transcription factor n=1 Tax=Duganella sp. SG902 TaxID=2587016 RepID=UPI00159E216D|nr:FixJ family two-component response regulator [Duganella sp. SG902]
MSYPDPQFSSIAIVDDDDAVRVGLRSLLRSYGYEANAYDSALAFLASGALGDYHCIITDLQMPGMSGIELLERLRRDGNPLPVILMTAFPEAALRKRAFQGGASCFLSKPFEANELLLCLKQASGSHNTTAEE